METDPTAETLAPESQPLRRLKLPAAPVVGVYGLIAVCLVVYVVDALSEKALMMWGAVLPGLVLRYGQVWRLLSAGFLHWDLQHLVFNLWALYVLGRDAERLYGTGRFLIGYLVALLAGNILVVGLSPMESATAGASGAILGIAGLLIVYFYFQRRLFSTREALSSLGRMVAINLLIGLLPGISLWGHLGGFIGGVLAGLVLYPRYALEETDAWTVTLRVLPLSGQQWAYLGALAMGLAGSLGFILVVR